MPAAGVTRVAAIDCGTNSIRLLIAERVAGRLRDVDRQMRIVRLGEGIDATGHFASPALARTLAAVAEYAELITAAGVANVSMIATSAARDAGNRQELSDGVRALLGIEPIIIDGQTEARLSFLGATGSLRERFPSPFLVIDLGGGSTEIVLGRHDHVAGISPDAGVAAALVRASHSMDVGCVRMTERHGTGEAAIRADVAAALDRAAADVPWQEAASVIGVAGTVTTVAAAYLGLTHYDPLLLHGAVIPRSGVSEVAQMFAGMTDVQRAALPYMHPGRVGVISAGAIVLDEVLARIGAEDLIASEHDILDGLAESMMDGRAP